MRLGRDEEVGVQGVGRRAARICARRPLFEPGAEADSARTAKCESRAMLCTTLRWLAVACRAWAHVVRLSSAGTTGGTGRWRRRSGRRLSASATTLSRPALWHRSNVYSATVITQCTCRGESTGCVRKAATARLLVYSKVLPKQVVAPQLERHHHSKHLLLVRGVQKLRRPHFVTGIRHHLTGAAGAALEQHPPCGEAGGIGLDHKGQPRVGGVHKHRFARERHLDALKEGALRVGLEPGCLLAG